ncbi:hypothetical protein V5F89_01460 [Pelagerythrobacter marensis]|uniref:Uncharacterized protein n=1 Tax=Pelagerythrobacter marensis TaxID=543877 RepID=A0ABZ2D711_9SPHN
MASADPNYPSPHAIWLREKIPGPLLFISIIMLPLILYGGVGGLCIGRYGLAATVFLCGGLPWLFLYTNGTGLKLAWDEHRVYMRPQSFRPPSWHRPWLERLPWRSLAYDEIASLDAITVNDPGARSFLLPFQLLRLTAKGATEEYDERHIWLYSLALRDKELAPLLRQLDTKCPGMLPEVVRQRLAEWADRHR